jgi:hypothetical protein
LVPKRLKTIKKKNNPLSLKDFRQMCLQKLAIATKSQFQHEGKGQQEAETLRTENETLKELINALLNKNLIL